MAYDSTGNPAYLLVPRLGGPKNPTSTANIGGIGGSLWGYTSTDPLATIIGSSYFANGWNLGMRKYDRVFATDEEAFEHLTNW